MIMVSMSDELAKAREYEEKEGALITDKERPVYHFSPRIGWLNDPNGLSFYGGKFHMFYQYYPYDSFWGPMHWGHALSRNLITWEYLPCALAPDRDEDRMGCFSGSAVTTMDGRHLLMYTGCTEDKSDPDHRWKQSQNIAIGNGRDYVKLSNNPVLDEEDLPDGADPHEFRDPYIWKTGSARYTALAANANTGNGGITQLTLYKSDDALHWRRSGVLFEDKLKIGIMWECPNFFQIGSDHVLIASPMDMQAEEADGSIRFPKGNNVCYMIGSFDDRTEEFHPNEDPLTGRYHYEPVDTGLDFYAPQVLRAHDGRKIMIGWMQDPATAMKHDKSMRVFGQMTVPRELSIKHGMLCQKPIGEIRALRKDRVDHNNIIVSDKEISLDGVKGRSTELIIYAENNGELYKELCIRFAKNDKYYTQLIYRPGQSIITIDRGRSGQADDIPSQRTVRVRPRKGRITLRILLDKWSSEVFINDGEQVMSATYYTDQDADDITFSADGSVKMNVTAYRLDPGKSDR
jgi:beta-fructofuranosidase